MLKLIKCEFLKLKRKPLVFISLLLSVFMPLAYAFFLADVNTDVDAVNGVMSSLFQLSAYLLLMPLLVILASNLLFEELDNDTLKNLVTIPINRTKLVLSKMLVLLLFAVGFMAVGGLVNLAVLLFQGWEPVGFWTLFGVGIEEGLIMWVGALPCILLVVLLNKNYIVSVVITFFYTTANYILSMSDAFLTQPFGLNIGTLFPGPLAFRWTFQFYDQSQTSAELADLLERMSVFSEWCSGVRCDCWGSRCISCADCVGLPAPGNLRGCNYVEFIKSRIAQATPVPNTLGGAGGACTLSVGAIWEPADCGGGVPKSKL